MLPSKSALFDDRHDICPAPGEDRGTSGRVNRRPYSMATHDALDSQNADFQPPRDRGGSDIAFVESSDALAGYFVLRLQQACLDERDDVFVPHVEINPDVPTRHLRR